MSSTCSSDGLTIRPALDLDRSVLALLLLDAYRGTIDDEGEGLEEAHEQRVDVDLVGQHAVDAAIEDAAEVAAAGAPPFTPASAAVAAEEAVAEPLDSAPEFIAAVAVPARVVKKDTIPPERESRARRRGRVSDPAPPS